MHGKFVLLLFQHMVSGCLTKKKWLSVLGTCHAEHLESKVGHHCSIKIDWLGVRAIFSFQRRMWVCAGVAVFCQQSLLDSMMLPQEQCSILLSCSFMSRLMDVLEEAIMS